jgi:hypothetical protein
MRIPNWRTSDLPPFIVRYLTMCGIIQRMTRCFLSSIAGSIICILIGANVALSQQYLVSTIAGNAPIPTPSAGLNASLAPTVLTTDSTGNTYFITLRGAPAVYKVDTNGVVTRLAGTGRAGGVYTDNSPAAGTAIPYVNGLTTDKSGNVFISSSSQI